MIFQQVEQEHIIKTKHHQLSMDPSKKHVYKRPLGPPYPECKGDREGRYSITCFQSNKWKDTLYQHHQDVHTGPRVRERLGGENCISFVKGSTETSHTFISALLRTSIQSSTLYRLLVRNFPFLPVNICGNSILGENSNDDIESVLNFQLCALQQTHPYYFLLHCF